MPQFIFSSGIFPSLVEIDTVGDLGDGHQGPEMKISLIHGSDQDEHGMDRMIHAGKIDAGFGTDQNEAELAFSFDQDMGDSQTGMDDSTGLFFTFQKHIK